MKQACVSIAGADPGLVDFAFGASPLVYFSARLDEALDVTYVSPNCEAVAGIEPARLLGPEGLAQQVCANALWRYREGVDALRRLGRVDGMLCLRSAPSGARWFRVRARLVSGRDGVAVHGCMEAIEDAPAAQAPARKTHSLSRLLIDAMDRVPSALGLLDADGRLILCNAAFSAPYDSIPGALVGQDQRQLARTFLARVARIDGRTITGSDEDIEWWASRLTHPGAEPAEVELKNGEWKLVSATAIAGGGLAVVRTDITPRKRVEESLRESESLVRQVLEACPAPVSMTQLQSGRVLYENPASSALFVDAPAAGSGRGRNVYADPEQEHAYLAALRAEGAVDGLEVDFARPDGTRFPVSLSARLIEYRDAEVIVATAQDLTERREMEDQMSRQREALHQSEKLSALGELLASVSHELNNPLSVVVGQALLMQETATDPRIIDRAEKIGDAAARCSRIVKAFLAMARQEPVECTLLEPNAILEAGLELCAYTLSDSDIRVTRRLGGGLPRVNGDKNQLAQVVTNLILNARYALQDIDGRREIKITSSYRPRTGEVVIKVKDNGPGVPEAVRGRIFEPLFTTKEVSAGTGIGLALCHRIVAAHGGILNLESPKEGGATFCIRLPAAATPEPVSAAAAAHRPRPDRLCVLVIDDEPAVAEMLADVAQAGGHEATVAHSAAQALDLISARSYDIVLSDVRMPGLDGPQFFEHLKLFHPHMQSRIIFITGDTLTPRVRCFLTRSGRPYIEKPVRPAEIRQLLAGIGTAQRHRANGARP